MDQTVLTAPGQLSASPETFPDDRRLAHAAV